ncbi:MAG: DNA replication/repair protein RecF [Chloroflexi bacterium]|nr:DNA replication/repair protein RecF [Chloroflexota bacterium]
MHLTRLALTNFRNYARLELDLAPGLTLLQGNNACGKTNLLEAIFYLATARSPHSGAERELLRWGASDEPIPFARVEAEIVKRNEMRTVLEIVLVQAAEKNREEAGKPNSRVNKRIKVNGVGKRALDLYGELNAVLFLPEDLDLVFGSPGDRRRYLDTTLAQVDPRYGRALSKYNQVLEQRNSLLRDFHERAFNPAELAIWDQQLVAEGAYLIARRAETVERYNGLTTEIHPRLTDGREELRLVYQPSVTLDAPAPARQPSLLPGEPASRTTDIASQFARQLEMMRPRELGAGLTLAGPHRDDLRFFIHRSAERNPIDAITYASRGQGRTIALSLKLAEVALMRGETGEDPVLLLDDVMSELDAPRRAALSQTVIDSPQAIITATDLDDFTDEFLSRARILHACDGQIENEKDA